ncbi:MAG TPA: radical SAM protein, partial [bacterium]|nr:radical SAM protein [bacterium]
MNIIIANSVGVDKNGYHIVHSPSRWSLGVKNYTDCIYYPWELSYASSYLKQKFPEHNIKMLDGVLNSYTFEEYIKVISEYNPDVLVMEPSARTYETDKLFAISVKEKFNAKIIFCGGLSTAEPEKLLEVADYVLQGEYEETLLELLKTNFDESIEGLYPNNRRKIIDINTLPFPEDDDVSRIKYFEPNCEYKEIQFYISRGCPMKCNFCVAGNLYYEKPNWRPRSIQNIIAEIKYLKNKYPEMEGLFLDEEVHNINKKFVLEFCDALIKNNLQHLKIDAMSEYYLLDEEILYKMKEAGYYKLRVGIETASDKIAKKMNLGNKFNLNKLFEVLEIANKIGMKMYGTFTVGGLGSNKNEDLKTVNLIYNLISNNLLNDLQVSINTPQPGTPFYIEAKEKKYFITEDWQSFDGGKGSVLSYPDYSKSEIDSMFKTALNKYDEALKIRAENFKFDLKIKNNLDMIIKPNSKILIIRSYRMWLVD